MQLPTFFKRQVFLNCAPGDITVPGGTFTSTTNSALSQAIGLRVGVGVSEGVSVEPSGVLLGVGELAGLPGVAEGPDTLISIHHGLFPCAPMPKSAPLAFWNIQ